MKTEPNAPAFSAMDNTEASKQTLNTDNIFYLGLTKREMFAMTALQGLLADPGTTRINSAAKTAVAAADLLIEELNKETNEG